MEARLGPVFPQQATQQYCNVYTRVGPPYPPIFHRGGDNLWIIEVFHVRPWLLASPGSPWV